MPINHFYYVKTEKKKTISRFHLFVFRDWGTFQFDEGLRRDNP